MSTMTLETCPFCGTDDHETSPWPSGDEWICRCGNPDCAVEVTAETPEAAVAKWNRRAHLSQPAQTVDEAMVERALAYRARQEDGAVWPDAYGTEEQAAEREQMRAMLSEALDANGPKAYCRACQRAGMSNCGYFDECAGAACITCHRPFATTRALRREGGPVGDGCLCAFMERVRPAVKDAYTRARLSVVAAKNGNYPEHYIPAFEQNETLWADILDEIDATLAGKPNIDALVDRFLRWPLPKGFAPDCGISFKHEPDALGYAPTWPIGTNLFDAEQAKSMIEHVLSIPASPAPDKEG